MHLHVVDGTIMVSTAWREKRTKANEDVRLVECVELQWKVQQRRLQCHPRRPATRGHLLWSTAILPRKITDTGLDQHSTHDQIYPAAATHVLRAVEQKQSGQSYPAASASVSTKTIFFSR